MNNKSSEVIRKKVYKTSDMILGVGLVVLAVILYLNKQHIIWPILSLIVGIGFIVNGSQIVSTQCPKCGIIISAIPEHEIYFECQKCESFLWNMKEEKRIELIDEDFIARESIFKWVLPWNGFALPGVTEVYGVIGGVMLKANDTKHLEARWPEDCCLCGSVADHQENISKKFRVTPGSKSGLIRSPITKDVSVFVNGIPHCQHHSGGAALKITNSNGVLAFRSLKYYRMFRELNK
jgi:ribosomal protein S27AE